MTAAIFLAAAAIAINLILVALTMLVLRTLSRIYEQGEAARIALDQMSDVVVTTPAKLATLSCELDAQIRQQHAALNEVLNVVEKASERAQYTARVVAGELGEREKKLDSGTEGVADDLAASRHRASATEGEPGAAADAALKEE